MPAHCVAVSPPAIATVHRARTAPGAASREPPGTPPFTRGQALGPGDPGHLFPPKPVAGSAETPRPAGISPRGDATLTRCGSRTRPAPRRSSPSQTRFQYATGILPRKPRSPERYPRERWTGSSGIRFRLGSGGRRPSGFRRAYACWSAAPAGR